VIAATLRHPPVPRLSRLMLWANLLVFAWGALQATDKNIFSEFLMPLRVVNGMQVRVVQNNDLFDILERSGWLRREDYLSGQWWRLLTCCFVHFGLIHLALNMLALRAISRDVEWAWGGWRFLVIYLLSGLGGSCAALAASDAAVAGASGAICGLVAGVAAWLLLNRRYLPRRMVRKELTRLFLTGVLITALSLAPGVSGAGHLGGAVLGLLAAVLLHGQRFGGGPVRVLALAGLLALPVACLVGLNGADLSVPQPAPEPHEPERVSVSRSELIKLENKARDLRAERLNLLQATRAERRDPEQVRQALAELTDLIPRFRDVARRLARVGRLRSERDEEERAAAEDYFRQATDYMEVIRSHLEEKRTWWKDKQAARTAKVAEAQQRWYKTVRKP
jgi:rhomboid protease GluP